MPQFEQVEFFLSQLFWLAVIFTGLYFVMARVALPRVAEVLEERSERLADDLERAEKLRQEAEEVVAGYEAALAKARSEAAGVLSETGKDIQTLTAKREAEFAANLSRKTAAAEARIAAAKAEAQAQVRDIALEATIDITARLVGSKAEDSAVSDTVDDVLKESAT